MLRRMSRNRCRKLGREFHTRTRPAQALAGWGSVGLVGALAGGLGGFARSQPLKEEAQAASPALSGKEDLYGGVLVEPAGMSKDPAGFREQLTRSLEAWRKEKKKGIWITLEPDLAALIPVAVEHGFHFHHASKEKGVTMYTWLSDAPCNIPNNASHYVPCSVAPALPDEQQVGVGVAVMDDQDRILVVQEKFGPAARRGKDFWKVPTGLVESGEDIAVAAEREVFEETGIRVHFEGVLAFRQQHGAGIEKKTDLFFLCKGKPLNSKIVPQAEWMPIQEFLSKPITPEGSAYWFLNRLAAESFLQGRGDLPGIRLPRSPATFVPAKMPIGFRPGHNFIYADGECHLPPSEQSKL